MSLNVAHNVKDAILIFIKSNDGLTNKKRHIFKHHRSSFLCSPDVQLPFKSLVSYFLSV